MGCIINLFVINGFANNNLNGITYNIKLSSVTVISKSMFEIFKTLSLVVEKGY
jgi:hypothetical protein